MNPTQDHDAIRAWAKAHNAIPAEISPYAFDSEPAILRFVMGEFPKDQPELREISWESFFAQFDLLGLSLVYDGDSQYELVYVQKKDDRTEKQV
jgi:hypothetical protein